MSINMSKGKKTLFLITVYLANVILMGEMIFSPIIYNLYEEFADSSMFLLNTIVSGPMLIIFLMSFVTAKLMKKYSTKSLMIVGGILFAVFGILSRYAPTAILMLLFRIPYSAGISIITTTGSVIITEVFVDEAQRTKYMGYYNAMMSAVSVAMSLVAGVLAVNNWRHGLDVYWVAVPIVILFVLFLPRIAPNKQEEEEKKETVAGGEKLRYGKNFWVMLIDFFIYGTAFAVTIYYGSVYIAENALGTTALAGTASSVNTAGSVIMCLLFGFLYGKLKGRLAFVFYILSGAAALLLYLVPSVPTLMVAYFFFGGSYGLIFAFIYAHASIIVPEGLSKSALALCSAAYSLSSFLCTYFITFVMGLMGTDKITPMFAVVAVICFIVAVIEFFATIRQRKSA